jgi:hypothetical protein
MPNGAQLFFDAEGTATRASGDLVATTTTSLNGGALTIQNNTATVNAFVATADEQTEGDEVFTIVLRSGFKDGPVVARSSSITIKDTSKKPTYSIQPNVSEINEGGEVTFNISTANVANGTQLTYSLSRTDVTPSTGTVTITDNKGSFKVTASNDSKTEGYTKFNATLKRGATDVVTSNDVGVKDTSLNPIIIPTISGTITAYNAIPSNKNVTIKYKLVWNIANVSSATLNDGAIALSSSKNGLASTNNTFKLNYSGGTKSVNVATLIAPKLSNNMFGGLGLLLKGVSFSG